MDILASEHEHDDTEPNEAEPTWGHPGTLGLTSLVLALLVFFNVGLLRGAPYVVIFAPHDNGRGEITGSEHGLIIAGAFLSAAFALIPLLLARAAVRRLLPSDGAWTGHLVRAALMLSVGAFVLRVVLALMSFGPNTNPFNNIFYV